jgi:hypothetical protein
MSICLIETKIKLYTDNNLRNKPHVYLGIFKLIFLNTTRFGTWYQIFVTVDFFLSTLTFRLIRKIIANM